MKDLKKIVESEKVSGNQNDPEKETTKPTGIKQNRGTVNNSKTEPKETLSDTVTVDATNEAKPISKKAAKAVAKIKAEGEIVVQKESDSKEEQGKPDSGKGKLKVIKKKAKKAEDKVDQLKKKVKKAKKKDVKKSKLNGLKEKLENALEKFKARVKKLKKAKK